MSKLQELIDHLCPNGVEFKPRGEIVSIVVAPKKFNKKEYQETGLYPIIDQGKSLIIGFTNDSSSLLPPKEYVLFGEHTRHVKYYNGSFAQGADGLKILLAKEIILPKYLFFAMECLIIEDRGYNRHWTVVSPMLIPIPPLEVQDEIVKILDRFSDYAAELQAELQARRLQYEYYRNLLLTFNTSAYGCGTDDAQKISVIARGGHSYEIQWKTMGEIGTFIRGKRFVRTDIIEEGIPCIHYGDMYTYYGLYASKTRGYINQEIGKKMRYAEKNDIVIVAAGENKDDLGNALAWLGEEPAAVHDACFIFRSEMYPNFLSHVCRTKSYHNQVRMFANEAKICSVSGTDLAKVVIPLPPYEIQIRIANILDRFETLVNDLSKGLPAEIEAVKARYEYYRNKLLTFNPLSA